MGSWRRPGGYGGGLGSLGPGATDEQQRAIERAAQEAERRIEAEHTGKRSWWKRLRYWLKP